MTHAPTLLAIMIAWLPEQRALAQAIAIDFVEPIASCERILNKKLKQQCLKIQGSPEADAYLTAVCEQQKTNQAFIECIGLAGNGTFTPQQLIPCQDEKLSDQSRLHCLSSALGQSASQNRQPASTTQKKRKKSSPRQ